MNSNNNKPAIYQTDLTRLPPALAPLIERPQWALWRWTQQDSGRWQKPPFMATQPERHASTKDPHTWADHGTALAAVKAGHGDGITYVLTEDDPFAAIDLDHCRNINTCSIDVWAQNFLDAGRHSYSEVTPSGTGCRIWGLASGDSLHKKFTLQIDGKEIAAELFRRTHKALTITGYKLDTIHELGNIDQLLDWAVVWGERRKVAAAEAAAPPAGNGFNGSGSGYSLDEIEQIVRSGAPAGAPVNLRPARRRCLAMVLKQRHRRLSWRTMIRGLGMMIQRRSKIRSCRRCLRTAIRMRGQLRAG